MGGGHRGDKALAAVAPCVSLGRVPLLLPLLQSPHRLPFPFRACSGALRDIVIATACCAVGAFGFYAIVARPNKLAWAKINAVRLCACESRGKEGMGV